MKKYVDERKLEIQCAVEKATIALRKKYDKEVANAMLADGFEPREIARYIKLPLKQINRLLLKRLFCFPTV